MTALLTYLLAFFHFSVAAVPGTPVERATPAAPATAARTDADHGNSWARADAFIDISNGF